MMFAGQSVRTSMKDLLRYATAYLDSAADVSSHAETKIKLPNERTISGKAGAFLGLTNTEAKRPARGTAKSPLVQIERTLRPHISRLVSGTLLEQTYGLGWNRTQLPGSLDFGWNSSLVDDFPLLGESYPDKLAIWHGGNMPGDTSALLMLPETGTAVAALQNSLGLCDVADLASQAVVDTLMAGKPMQDYLGLANRCVETRLHRIDQVEAKLKDERIPNTKPRQQKAYVGRYMNSIANWFIDINISESESLQLRFIGLEEEQYELRHYHHDTFAWNQSYDELTKRGQYIRAYEYYRLEFESEKAENSEITQLKWRHDKTVPEGEIFKRAVES